ncbi:MAG: hypothetical protein ACR2QC_04425 [Gammaproteobacteria bacterium]
MNVEPTAKEIRNAAMMLRDKADDLEACAKRLSDEQDWCHLAQAMTIIQNVLSGIRLDLFVTKPIRAIQKPSSDCREIVQALHRS